jgi:hypothetical protein
MDAAMQANLEQRRNVMRTTTLRNPRLANLALVALSIFVAPIAKAECGTAAHNNVGLASALRSLNEPAAHGEENDSPQAASPGAQDQGKNDSAANVLGLWKKVYFDEDGTLE